jgi:transcriptional regulator with XRE-family HTH domain
VRDALGPSRAAFAERFGLDVTALQAWEQGRRLPDRAARIPLAIIAREPEAVRRALAAGDASVPKRPRRWPAVPAQGTPPPSDRRRREVQPTSARRSRAGTHVCVT